MRWRTTGSLGSSVSVMVTQSEVCSIRSAVRVTVMLSSTAVMLVPMC